MKKYPAYKDSGVPWFGEVPQLWEVVRLGALLIERGEKNAGPKTENILSLLKDVGVINYEDKGDIGNKKSEDIERYKIVHQGDIVVNSMNVIIGSVGMSREYGALSPVYYVLRAANNSVYVPYYDYLFKIRPFQDSLKRIGYGIMDHRMRIPMVLLKKEPLPKPPIAEQKAIVAYLDEKTAVINKFITHKQWLIELLQEQKQVVVNTAVTQGLDPHVPRKPSGIEWLGDIPAHWQGVRLKQLSEFIQTGPFGSQLHVHDYVDNKTPVINPIHLQNGQIVPDLGITVNEDVVARLSRHQLQVGDVILARRGELGRCAVVDLESSGWLCGTGSMNLRPKPNMVYSPYLAQVFQTEKVKTWLSTESVGSTMDNLNLTILSNLKVPLPPVYEQEQIIRFCREMERKIDTTIERAQREIELIEEYRTTLIATAVTGKIDVRDFMQKTLEIQVR